MTGSDLCFKGSAVGRGEPRLEEDLGGLAVQPAHRADGIWPFQSSGSHYLFVTLVREP